MKLGSKTLSISGEGDDKAIIKHMSFWAQMPEKCGKCGSVNLFLNFRSPKGNDYYGLRCGACGADCNFGQLKTGGFYHKNEWKVWASGDKVESQTEAPITDDDIVF
jgi:hypothetical protein